jgi:HPt (histidine-containing phosphotransfer) domain-containing protein
MIDKDYIRENLRFYDKSVIAEVIDLFISEYPTRIEILQNNVAELDFEAISHNSHSLKGIVAYLSPEIFELSRELEKLGRDKSAENIGDVYSKLKSATVELVKVLNEMRKEYD